MACGNCGRKLKDAKSMERGYGPVCWKRINGIEVPKRKKRTSAPKALVDNYIPGQLSIEDFKEVMPGEIENREVGERVCMP